MKLLRMLIFMICLSGMAQAQQKVGYIYTVNGIDADFREIKNLNVIRGIDGEGFLQVHAITGHDRWNIRCIRTDDDGLTIWMKDYNFKPYNDQDTSTCPFAVCHNLNGDGYVLAGIWGTKFSYDHSELESPFYIEIDDNGSIIRASRQKISLDTCFAPLKIKPSYEDQTYVVAGVSGNRMDRITSDYRAARVCKLDAQLNELPGAREIKSTYATNTGIANFGRIYDAFNNVEVVYDGSSYSYIVSGCITDDLYRANTLHPSYGMFGRAAPFIAKMDTNLNLIWYKADYAIDSTYDHSIVTDVDYDADRNSLYVIHMRSSIEGNEVALEIRELDFTNGNEAQTPVLTTTFDSAARFENLDIPNYFFTKVFVSGDELILVGYAMEDSSLIGPSSPKDKIDPFYLSLDKTDLSVLNYAHCDASCISFGFLSHNWVQGYLGHRYPFTYSDFMVADKRTTIPYTLINTTSHAPIIYVPEITVTGFNPGDADPVILAIAGAENYNQLHGSGEKFPFLNKIMNAALCVDSTTSTEPIEMYELGSRTIIDTSINFADTLNAHVVSVDFDVFYRDCSFYNNLVAHPTRKVDYLQFSSTESLLQHLEEYGMREVDHPQSWDLKHLFSITGATLPTKQDYLKAGIYVAHIQNGIGDHKVLKVIVY